MGGGAGHGQGLLHQTKTAGVSVGMQLHTWQAGHTSSSTTSAQVYTCIWHVHIHENHPSGGHEHSMRMGLDVHMCVHVRCWTCLAVCARHSSPTSRAQDTCGTGSTMHQ